MPTTIPTLRPGGSWRYSPCRVGMTRKEAARQLGIPEGSVASRLARARGMLAE